ncbi:uncharacterized protein LOC118198108 [Stegodyphus dumicola]|uniref:uncharacterized protein LOC118198108 n=1 Tax=Stegodyphus dumicola TaxID=202533 RepID=UPI0015B00BDE|nr:uncharacterized protein LOC118198108 [Stegodyphus dumicola]
MTWIPHVQDLKLRTAAIAKQMKLFYGHKWGLNPHIQKVLYTTVIEKIVTYAAAVWAYPMQGRKVRHLNSIQRPFALGITRAYRTTSTDAINVLAGLLPLHIRVEEEAARQHILQLKKAVTFDDETYYPDEYETNFCPLDVPPAEKGKGILISINPTATHHSREMTIYTDGSRLDERVGCAYVATKQDNAIEKWKGQLRQHNSVFQSEAVAIAQAIRYLHSHQHSHVTIKTDSLSSLYAIWNADHPSEIIQGIQRDLRSNPQYRTKLEWIKAHVGHYGNELADQLAKEATTDPPDAPIIIPWPHSYLKKTLRLRATGMWQNEWDQSTTGRRTHYFIGYVDTSRNVANAQLVRFISGHGPYPEYFFKRGISHTSQCACGDSGSPEHYLSNINRRTAYQSP